MQQFGFSSNMNQQAINNFDELANENDIYHCYRLLLGRKPDPDGWNTWTSAIQGGMSINTLVLCFLGSPEFKNRSLSPSVSGTKYELVELPDFKIYVPTDDWAIGRHILVQKFYEPHVTSVIKSVLSPGMGFLDIGANIGYFSLMAASLVGSSGKVFSFEPSQHNCNCLYLSAKTNNFDNIDIYPFAVAEKQATFIYDTTLGTNGCISEFDNNLTIEESRSLVRSMVLDEVLRDVERINLIKIDIEGAEFRALEGAKEIFKKHRPLIISEFSPPALKNVSKVSGENYLKKLLAENYYISVIEPTGQLTECVDDIAKVMKIYESKKASHVDIFAYPR